MNWSDENAGIMMTSIILLSEDFLLKLWEIRRETPKCTRSELHTVWNCEIVID